MAEQHPPYEKFLRRGWGPGEGEERQAKPVLLKDSSPPPGLLPWQRYFLAALLGIWALRWPWPALAGLAALWVCCRWLLSDPGERPRAGLLGLCFLAGLGCAWASLPTIPATPQWMDGRAKAVIRGRVVDVDSRPGGLLRCILADVECRLDDGRRELLPGRLAWTWQDPPPVESGAARPLPGQQVLLRAVVKRADTFANPGGFDARFHWQRQGVFWRAWTTADKSPVFVSGATSAFWSWREGLRRKVEAGLQASELAGSRGGALLQALLLGEGLGLDRPTQELLTGAGLVHILSLSGQHLAMVASLGWVLAWLAGRLHPGIYLRWPRPRLAVLLAAPLVLLYWRLGGASASLTRSALMFASFGGLLLLGRGRVLLDGLFLALLAILLLDPLAAYDLGLQLSSLAIVGLAVGLPPLMGPVRRLCDRVPWRRPRAAVLGLGSMLAAGLATNLAMSPLLMATFGRLSPNYLWNILWLPVLSLVSMPLGFLGLFLCVVPGLGTAASQTLGLAGMSMDGLFGLLDLGRAWGLADQWTTQRPMQAELLGLWALLLVGFVRLPDRGRTWMLTAAAALLVLPGFLRGAGQGDVRLTLLDVGHGQAAVIQAPDGRRVLLDGGGVSPDFDIGQVVVLPALTWGAPPWLDGVLLSHPDADHAQGLGAVLETLRVGWFATGVGSPIPWRLSRALEARGPRPSFLAAGDSLDLGSGLTLEVLGPAPDVPSESTNDASLVLRLSWFGQGLALLPGDVGRHGLARLLDSGQPLDVQVLVLPHHGSDSSLSPALYDRTAPRLAVASAGTTGRFIHPGPRVRDELGRRGLPLLTTGSCGAVELRWPGPRGGPVAQTVRPCAAAGAPGPGSAGP